MIGDINLFQLDQNNHAGDSVKPTKEIRDLERFVEVYRTTRLEYRLEPGNYVICTLPNLKKGKITGRFSFDQKWHVNTNKTEQRKSNAWYEIKFDVKEGGQLIIPWTITIQDDKFENLNLKTEQASQCLQYSFKTSETTRKRYTL